MGMPACPLIRCPDPTRFATSLRTLHQRFCCYAGTSPQPLPASGLVVTPELRYQSELYLPVNEIKRLFYRFYGAALSYPPLFSNSPFHRTPSWADCYAGFPGWLQLSPNPVCLLQQILGDGQLRTRFLCYSFLPTRFNGLGFGRYPGQLAWLREFLTVQRAIGKQSLRMLDAACGSGEGSWELVALVDQLGWHPDQVQVAGWTLDPLEVWAAEQQWLPHQPERETRYRQEVQPLQDRGWSGRISFDRVDLLQEIPANETFDLIVCNGLLGGPLVHLPLELNRIVTSLSRLLAPGGALVAANRFHDGWKQQVPDSALADMLKLQGLHLLHTDNGLAGVRQM